MKTGDGIIDDFNWAELLVRIKRGKVIPVIGHGMYAIEREGKEVLLYDYLTEKLAHEINTNPPENVNHKFSKIAFEYLKKYNSTELKRFLLNILESEEFVVSDTLWKLANIRAFKIFINTSYDNLLLETIKTVRDYPTDMLSYTVHGKKLYMLNDQLFIDLAKHKRTLVYCIFGNLPEFVDVAITEKDILEAIVKFREDMDLEPRNNLFQELKTSSLLFMGCGYDDWLFRFFIRIVAHEPFQFHRALPTCKFVGDSFDEIANDPRNELPHFLEEYESVVYNTSASGGKKFVDRLFEEVQKNDPDGIIKPGTAFISFTGADRTAAGNLNRNLKGDDIFTWQDENELEPGTKVDEEIIKAIDKSPVFIPLISSKSERISEVKGELKYHCREWEWAYFNMKNGKNPKCIIPVKIDSTDWMYDRFKQFAFLKIPGGNKAGEYEKLKKRLLKIQKQEIID